MPSPDPVVPLRTVRRAMAELRGGAPLRLHGAADTLILSAEAADAASLAEFLSLTALAGDGGSPPMLVLPALPSDAPPRALDLPGPVDVARLGRLFDRVDPWPQSRLPRPLSDAMAADMAAALHLARLCRLLPALLAVACPEPWPASCGAAADGLLSVAAASVLAVPDAGVAAPRRVAMSRVPLAAAPDARLVGYRAADTGLEHLAILVGAPDAPGAPAAPLVRLHSECLTGDILASLRCDCGAQLHQALDRMRREGGGVVLYLAQEGRGIGLMNKLRAYHLQDGADGAPPLDTLDANLALGYGADERDYAVAAAMLRDLGLARVRLLTNNPAKLAAMARAGIDVVSREPIAPSANGVNDAYLSTKSRRFGHMLPE